ncbi:MAG: right-handed parallel beta-helix repeat-containing protein [Acidobacteriaceae bacterium]
MINRRDFLSQALACSAAAGLAAAWPRSIAASIPASNRPGGTAHRASVADFGADPTGVRDVTDAVQRAIASLGLSQARLVFPPGKYNFAASDSCAMSFRNYNGLEVFGNGAELIFNGNTRPFLLSACRNVEIHDIKIDWARPPFSQGTVTTVAGGNPPSFTVVLDPDFPADGTESVEWLSEYDAKTGLPAAGGLDASGVIRSVRLSAPQTLTLACSQPLAVKPGMRLMLRHRVAAAACLHLEACDTVLLESVAIFAGPGKGAVLHGCRDVSLEDFSVMPRPQSRRWLSLCGRGVEMVGCEGTVAIKRSQFKGTGDDAFHIYQPYWKISSRVDETTVMLEGTGKQALPLWQLPSAGTILQLTDAANLSLLGEIAVASCENTPAGTKLAFSETLSPVIKPGTLVCSVLKQARATIDHCSFSGNRGRGVVAHARTRIVNSRFHGCSGPAIQFAANPEAMAGPVVQSVSVTDSTIDLCNYGGQEERRGAILVGAARDARLAAAPAQRINQGVTLSRNLIGNVSGPAIDCADASWLTIEGNTFGRCDVSARPADKPRAIVLRNVAQSQIDGNQSKLPQQIVLIGCTDTAVAVNNEPMVAVKA